jgi:hypothetical protein
VPAHEEKASTTLRKQKKQSGKNAFVKEMTGLNTNMQNSEFRKGFKNAFQPLNELK